MPGKLVSVLAKAMDALWKVDASDCPVKNDLSMMLRKAEYRVEHGMVDVDDAEPETFVKGGFKAPEDLFTGFMTTDRRRILLFHTTIFVFRIFLLKITSFPVLLI